MNNALKLLNQILAESQPDEVVFLPLREAEELAALDERELGDLSAKIAKVGVVDALQSEGLFARRVVILFGQCEDLSAAFNN